METKSRKVDPLTLLPPIPFLEIARNERVSGDCVTAAIARLGVSMMVTPTGRKMVAANDAVRIVEHIRSRAFRG